MFKSLGYVGVVIFIIGLIALFVLGPWIVIWAWNTLFGVSYLIPYTFNTWLAVLIFGMFIRSDIKVSRKT